MTKIYSSYFSPASFAYSNLQENLKQKSNLQRLSDIVEKSRAKEIKTLDE